MYYRVIVISEEAKGHVSDKERKLVLNYKSTVELNEFGLQLLLKDFTPYNITVIKTKHRHNRKGHYYETTDNLSTLCEKIREFLVTGDIEEEREECTTIKDLFKLPNDKDLYIKDRFINTFGYLFFKINTENPLYNGVKQDYLCTKLNEDRNIFHVSKNKEWIYTKENYKYIEIKNNVLVLTREIHYMSKQIVHREFKF